MARAIRLHQIGGPALPAAAAQSGHDQGQDIPRPHVAALEPGHQIDQRAAGQIGFQLGQCAKRQLQDTNLTVDRQARFACPGVGHQIAVKVRTPADAIDIS